MCDKIMSNMTLTMCEMAMMIALKIIIFYKSRVLNITP